MPTRREVCLDYGREAEKKGEWSCAAVNYLEAGSPNKVVSTVRRITEEDMFCNNLVREEHLQLMKQYGILDQVAKHLTDQAIKLRDLADSLKKIGEHELAATCYMKCAGTQRDRSYLYQDAAECFADGGKREAALECLLQLYGESKDIHYERLHKIYEMGVLDEFIERATKNPAVATGLIESVSQWPGCPDPKYLISFTAWRESGGLSRFFGRTLKIDPIAVGGAYCRYNDIKSDLDADMVTRCYEAVINSGSLSEKDKQELTMWVPKVARYWQERGDHEKAASLWSEVPRFSSDTVMKAAAYSYAATCFIEAGNYASAAVMLEEEENCFRMQRDMWFSDSAAKLYERAGKIQQAAAVYERSGRKAKAKRIAGQREYNLNEAKSMPPLYSRLTVDDSRPFVRRLDLSSCSEAEAAYKKGDTETTVAAWKQDLMTRSHVYEHWYFIPEFYKRAGQMDKYRSALRDVEEYFRRKGEWIFAAKMYFSDEQYDDFDRVCIEEDELEIAALWYEQANMPERAAKIYDLMGQSGKSGKAQSEGAKQKPQDAGQPKSESAEETNEEELEQLVCPQCGAEIKPHWTVCPKCDADLQVQKCKNCGEPLEPDWKRCPVCGTIIKG